MPNLNAIPRYFLYGEAPVDVELFFLQVETIPTRSGPHDWTIRAHAHPDHHQVLVMSQGGGRLHLDEDVWSFDAPALLVVPALAVHAFEFHPDSDGFVITLSTDFLHTAIEGDEALATAFSRRARCVYNDIDTASGLLDAFQSIAREFVWSAPGRRTAIKAHFQRILVTLARLQGGDAPGDGQWHSRDTEIVVRYRELIERDFRRQPPLERFAGMLGVTSARLNLACRSVIGKTALTLLHDRIVIEAKRNLLYTGMTVAEIAWSVGFADPAYFNRFFSRRTGGSPGAFRAATARKADDGKSNRKPEKSIAGP